MEEPMSSAAEDAIVYRKSHPGPAHGRAAVSDPRTFWVVQIKRQNAGVKEWRRAFHDLVGRVIASPGVTLFNAVEAGVPTYLVNVIAGATGEPLPDVAGHRVMGFLRVAATLRRLLEESGDPEQLKDFDLEGWVAQWMREQLAELRGKTPAEMLRNPEGQRAIEQVLERMRGGLP